MILLPFASGKTYGVVGLGKSGRATVASLLASGAQVLAWDDGEAGRAAVAKEFPSITMKPVAEWDYSALTSLVMSPGIFLTHPTVQAAQAAGVEVIGDVELLYRAQPQATYIGITGTNGKSTTTTLIAHILRACGKRVEVGGNLGTPALALAPLGVGEMYVLELSSYQLDLVRSTRFNIAVLLNISPDHLDHHGSMENYIAAKLHIFDRMERGDTAVIGVDDAVSAGIYEVLRMKNASIVLPISATKKTAQVYTYRSWLRGRRKLCMIYGHESGGGDITNIKSLQGEHNWQNAAAAYAACYACGCWPEAIIAAMQTYAGLAHRMEWLGEIAGVQFVNDSKATNADAAEKALKTYDNIYWILGGVAKEGGIESLAPYFAKIRHAYLIGEAAEMFAQVLEGRVPFTHSGTLEKAFQAARIDAQREGVKGAAVLLSPACASFDQFPNFEVRGAAFAALVDALKQGGSHAATA